MANTPNYNLKKVEYTEIADIPGHFNANFDTIDTVMKNNADAAVAAEDNAKSYASGLIGALSNLLTTAKNNIVAAVNEIFGKVEDVETDLAAHKAEIVQQSLFVDRDLSILGTQTISTLENRDIKSIEVFGKVHYDKYFSYGKWVKGSSDSSSRGYYKDRDTGNYYTQDVGQQIVFSNSGLANRVRGSITNVQKGSFDIIWDIRSGEGINATCRLMIIITYHGE